MLRKLHNEVLWDSYCSSNIRAVRCRKLRCSGQVARVDVLRYVFKIIVKPEEEREFLELVCVLEYNINERVWTGWIWTRWGSLAGRYERDNEILGSIKMWNFMARWGSVSFSRRLLPRGVSFFFFYRVVFCVPSEIPRWHAVRYRYLNISTTGLRFYTYCRLI